MPETGYNRQKNPVLSVVTVTIELFGQRGDFGWCKSGQFADVLDSVRCFTHHSEPIGRKELNPGAIGGALLCSPNRLPFVQGMYCF